MRRKQVSQQRTIANYGMGAFFLLTGIFFLVYDDLGINFLGIEPGPIDNLIGVLFVLYGAWRIYRGYKKNYFRE
ncbi:MAG TPA: hypothetical protein VHK69_18710 [Chitinophagaceae bacterium]|nr:hypothetical protein [Chitinophagaceae bacterium]